MNASLTPVYAPMYMVGMGIAERIDRMMRERKIKSQSALARASGVPQPTIARILNRQNVPELNTVTKLASALGVTTTWLTDGPDEAPVYSQSRSLAQDDETSRTAIALRQAQIERAVQLLTNLADADLSHAIGMLQDFSRQREIEGGSGIKVGHGGIPLGHAKQTGSGS
jgi:transcriptional regulator with XRE-family HTH domain